MSKFLALTICTCLVFSSTAYAISPQYRKSRVVEKPVVIEVEPNPVGGAKILKSGEVVSENGIFFNVKTANKLKKQIELLMVESSRAKILDRKVELLLKQLEIEKKVSRLDERTVNEYENYTNLIEERLSKAEKKADSPWRNPLLMILIGLVGGLATGVGLSR